MKGFAEVAIQIPRSGIREILELATSMQDVIHLEIGQLEPVWRQYLNGHLRFSCANLAENIQLALAVFGCPWKAEYTNHCPLLKLQASPCSLKWQPLTWV